MKLYLRLGLKLKKKKKKKKKKTSRIRIQSISMTKTIVWIQHTKKNRNRKNGVVDGKAFYKLMNKVLYGKANGKLKK